MATRTLVIAGVVTAAVAAPGAARADAVDLAAVVASIDAGDGADVIARLAPRRAALDATERCALGLAYAGPDRRGARPDRARAFIYLPSCGGAPAAIADRAEAARARLVAQAERAGDGQIEIAAGDAVHVPVTIDRLDGDVVLAPATLWLGAGDYRFTAHLPDGTLLVTERALVKRTTANVLFELPKQAPPPSGPRTLDYGDGEPEVGTTFVGPPPKQQHKSLIDKRFQKGIEANRAAARRDRAEPLDASPLAAALGFRIGGGVVDSSAGGATGAVSIAALGRLVIDRRGLAGELRVDVGPRGSDTARVWTIGAAAQARWYVAASGPLAGVSIAAGARTEVRTADHIDAMTVERFGLGAVGGIGWEPGTRRFAIELRGEQALTSLGGARPHAVLLELGFNL